MLVAARGGFLRKLLVFVVAAPPDALLVAALRGAVEPLVHAPQDVEAPGIRRIGMVDLALLADERTHAGSIARESRRVGAAAGCELRDGLVDRLCVHRVAGAAIVVFYGT